MIKWIPSLRNIIPEGWKDLANLRSDWCQNNNQRNINLNDHNKDSIYEELLIYLTYHHQLIRYYNLHYIYIAILGPRGLEGQLIFLLSVASIGVILKLLQTLVLEDSVVGHLSAAQVSFM